MEFDNLDIHIRALRDNQQLNDPDGIAEDLGISPATWSLFGLLWESSEVLATVMLNFDVTSKRILEVGCGIGLSSLVLNSRDADITASDHHPDAAENLRWNTRLNGGAAIPFFRADWEGDNLGLGKFDLIIGSDILYQPNHPELLSRFVDQHALAESEVILVDPKRGNFSKFGREMALYGFDQTELPGAKAIMKAQDFKGQARSFKRHG